MARVRDSHRSGRPDWPARKQSVPVVGEGEGSNVLLSSNIPLDHVLISAPVVRYPPVVDPPQTGDGDR